MRASTVLNRRDRRSLKSGKKQRTKKRCLFYGLSQPVGSTFIDKKDGRCALIPHEGRCKKEKNGDAVDWKQCHFFNTFENRGVFECIISKYKVLPSGKAETVSLKDWAAQVMEK